MESQEKSRSVHAYGIPNANCMHLKIAIRIRSCQFSANKHLTFILRFFFSTGFRLNIQIANARKKRISEFIVNPSARKIKRILDDVTHFEVLSRCQQSSSISFVLVSLSQKMQTFHGSHEKSMCSATQLAKIHGNENLNPSPFDTASQCPNTCEKNASICCLLSTQHAQSILISRHSHTYTHRVSIQCAYGIIGIIYILMLACGFSVWIAYSSRTLIHIIMPVIPFQECEKFESRCLLFDFYSTLYDVIRL